MSKIVTIAISVLLALTLACVLCLSSFTLTSQKPAYASTYSETVNGHDQNSSTLFYLYRGYYRVISNYSGNYDYDGTGDNFIADLYQQGDPDYFSGWDVNDIDVSNHHSDQLYVDRSAYYWVDISICAGSSTSWSFQFQLEKLSLSKPSSVSKIKVGNNKITPYWHRQTSSANTSGYEIAYKKAGSNHYSYKYASGCDTSHKTIKVGNHKRYYVKVRVYKTLSGKKYYSTWTGTKKSAYTK